MRILVVDDVGYSRHNIAMALTRLGHVVDQADSGNAGLRILRNDHTIEVVITDLIMDGMDGVDFFISAKRLQTVDDQGRTSFPSFVLLTSAQPGLPAATQTILARLKLAMRLDFRKSRINPSIQSPLRKRSMNCSRPRRNPPWMSSH